ncbi:hypothetical protein ZWY2020_050984 [Hordeum vulgare]|nr:hypothetical protein ZWY2020_050984 [Hordeum vulgare]
MPSSASQGHRPGSATTALCEPERAWSLRGTSSTAPASSSPWCSGGPGGPTVRPCRRLSSEAWGRAARPLLGLGEAPPSAAPTFKALSYAVVLSCMAVLSNLPLSCAIVLLLLLASQWPDLDSLSPSSWTSTPASEADVRRKGCKVAPEPKDGEEAEALPGSASFRIYCQKAAAQVDALVANTANGDHDDGFVRTVDSNLVVRKNDPPRCSGELPKCKEGWLKLRGHTVFDTLYNLFVCHSKITSAPRAPKPPRRPGDASPAAAAAAAAATGPYL